MTPNSLFDLKDYTRDELHTFFKKGLILIYNNATTVYYNRTHNRIEYLSNSTYARGRRDGALLPSYYSKDHPDSSSLRCVIHTPPQLRVYTRALSCK